MHIRNSFFDTKRSGVNGFTTSLTGRYCSDATSDVILHCEKCDTVWKLEIGDLEEETCVISTRLKGQEYRNVMTRFGFSRWDLVAEKYKKHVSTSCVII